MIANGKLWLPTHFYKMEGCSFYEDGKLIVAEWMSRQRERLLVSGKNVWQIPDFRSKVQDSMELVSMGVEY